MNIVITTCDKNLWALQAFSHQFTKYWKLRDHDKVIVAGFSSPKFTLPKQFEFLSLGKFQDYPADKWSDAIHKLLETVEFDRFVWMLEDYWLTRYVDIEAIDMLDEYMSYRQDILRIDLTSDRLGSGGAYDVSPWGRLDLIRVHPSFQYHISLQAALWNRHKLQEVLPRHISPWEFEIQGSGSIEQNFPSLVVLGTRQWPVRYQIALWNDQKGLSLQGLSVRDIEDLRERGYLHDRDSS